ncbi:MAG: hypothetical protein HUJ80_03185 [Firmicutes bacterium]|nr:hypothetical protein [Bacillota bacterium]
MKMHDLHGTVEQDQIGKKLREYASSGESEFKILTGYGSTSGKCQSKATALRVLGKMKREGLIKAYLPAEKCKAVLWTTDSFYETKQQYQKRLASDRDAQIGNDGVIFVFVK